MIWWWVGFIEADDSCRSGAFVRAPSIMPDRAVAAIIELRGLDTGTATHLDVRSLPRLDDQIPDHFLDRVLNLDELSEIDRILGGDGTFTIPASMRG